jgi:hypothetical protein
MDATEAFVLLKVLDADGDTGWSYRTTNRLNREEMLGALTVQVDVAGPRELSVGGGCSRSGLAGRIGRLTLAVLACQHTTRWLYEVL